MLRRVITAGISVMKKGITDLANIRNKAGFGRVPIGGCYNIHDLVW